MKSYIIPKAELQPEVIVPHYSINDLWQTVSLVVTAREIVASRASVKIKKNATIISGITARKDQYKYKARDTNECLKKLCNNRNIRFVEQNIRFV